MGMVNLGEPRLVRPNGSCAWRKKSVTCCPGSLDAVNSAIRIWPLPEVRIGPDLKKATAFISRLGRSDADALIPALVKATPYLRGQVAKVLRLRIAPDLTFTPDRALDYAMKIEELMHRPEIARDLQKD